MLWFRMAWFLLHTLDAAGVQSASRVFWGQLNIAPGIFHTLRQMWLYVNNRTMWTNSPHNYSISSKYQCVFTFLIQPPVFGLCDSWRFTGCCGGAHSGRTVSLCSDLNEHWSESLRRAVGKLLASPTHLCFSPAVKPQKGFCSSWHWFITAKTMHDVTDHCLLNQILSCVQICYEITSHVIFT